MPFKDPEKKREYRRKWYSLNKDSEKAHVKKRKNNIRKWFQDHKKNLSCVKCGESHEATIEFHHKNSLRKEMEISKMVAEGYSKEKILNEMNKCSILCSNCHKKKHYKKI